MVVKSLADTVCLCGEQECCCVICLHHLDLGYEELECKCEHEGSVCVVASLPERKIVCNRVRWVRQFYLLFNAISWLCGDLPACVYFYHVLYQAAGSLQIIVIYICYVLKAF
jgi:hypothetical protein